MKEWEDMIYNNSFYTVIGLFLHYCIWVFSFYISISFVAVWKIQVNAYMVSMIWCDKMDFLVFEIIVEFIISLIYLGRKNNEFLRKIGNF